MDIGKVHNVKHSLLVKCVKGSKILMVRICLSMVFLFNNTKTLNPYHVKKEKCGSDTLYKWKYTIFIIIVSSSSARKFAVAVEIGAWNKYYFVNHLPWNSTKWVKSLMPVFTLKPNNHRNILYWRGQHLCWKRSKKWTAFFWVFTHRIVVIRYLRFETTYQFHLQGSRVQKEEITQKHNNLWIL